MHTDRANFIARLDALKSACDQPLLVNTADSLHNERAKQLRCGICVMVFSSLEEFIKLRAASVLQLLNPATLPLQNIPEKLLSAATQGAMQGVNFQQKFIPEHQRTTFLATELKCIGTALDQNYRISKYSFVNSGSNVSLLEVTNLLDALCVEKPWEAVYHTARRLNLATANPSKLEFETLSDNRHAAAHKQTFDIPNLDLKARIDSALSIGVALDVVLTAAVRNLNACMVKYQKIQDMKSKTIEIYFISAVHAKNKFRLEQEGGKRAIKTGTNLQLIKAEGLLKLAPSAGIVVLHDGTYRPKEWYCEP